MLWQNAAVIKHYLKDEYWANEAMYVYEICHIRYMCCANNDCFYRDNLTAYFDWSDCWISPLHKVKKWAAGIILSCRWRELGKHIKMLWLVYFILIARSMVLLSLSINMCKLHTVSVVFGYSYPGDFFFYLEMRSLIHTDNIKQFLDNIFFRFIVHHMSLFMLIFSVVTIFSAFLLLI